MSKTNVEAVKCACPDCVCVVSVTQAIEKSGRLFCAESCANSHGDGKGCGHTGCSCHG